MLAASTPPSGASFLASDPHVPMAIARGTPVSAPPDGACRGWSTVGGRWLALDAYGQIVGTAEVASRSWYDVTNCYELKLRATGGAPGVGLYVGAGGTYRAPRSAAWTPSADEEALFAALAADLRAAMKPAERRARTLFFRVSARREGDAEEHFAALGGPTLVIARLEGHRWRAVFTDDAIAKGSTATDDSGESYRPFAVFDMDGDGDPELVVHTRELAFWGDLVYGRRGGAFSVVAHGVPGSTA
jgi:hypothetical protein